MKSISQTIACAFLIIFLSARMGYSQVLPQKLLDAAQAQYVKAYQAEFGAPPSANDTKRAMQNFKMIVSTYPKNSGARAGKKAKR